MLAVVYRGPELLRVEERPVPHIGPDEVLLKVLATTICGTDLRILHGAHRQYPAGTTRIPGHEVAGEIVQVGKHVRGLAIGERVFVAPNIGCGRCSHCVAGHHNLCADYQAFGVTMDGSFAEYMRITAAAISQGNVIPVAERVDPSAAALIEPLACVLRGQAALQIRPGDLVLVIGAGPIGILHLLLAKLHGAGLVLVSEMIQERAAQAARYGADRTINPAQEDLAKVVAQESGGRGADVVIVAAPSAQAQEGALGLAASEGRINFFGGLPKDRSTINLDSNLIHYKELRVTGTTGCSTEDCRRSASIVRSGRLDLSSLISARYPLERAEEAFGAAEHRRSLKIALQPRIWEPIG